jgi:hypothetical protein
MKLDKGLISFFVICLLFALVLVHDHNRAEEAKVRRAQDVSKRREAEARSSQRAADLDKREKDIRASVEKLSTPVKGAGIIDEIKHGPRAFLDDNQKTAQKDTEGVVKKIREPLPTLAEVQADLGPATRNAAETSFVRARVYSLSGGRFAGTETVPCSCITLYWDRDPSEPMPSTIVAATFQNIGKPDAMRLQMIRIYGYRTVEQIGTTVYDWSVKSE